MPSPLGSVVASGGDALFERHPPPASRPSSDSSRRGARRGTATVSRRRGEPWPVFRVSRRDRCFDWTISRDGFPGWEGAGARCRGGEFPCGTPNGRIAPLLALSVGRVQRSRYTWLWRRPARCERLDCGGDDETRDKRARAVDDQGVAGQNSVFGPAAALAVTKNAAAGRWTV